MSCARHEAEQNHWNECARATSIANADALARPRRSVLALDLMTTSRQFGAVNRKLVIWLGIPALILVCVVGPKSLASLRLANDLGS